jgi:hypothetical protein
MAAQYVLLTGNAGPSNQSPVKKSCGSYLGKVLLDRRNIFGNPTPLHRLHYVS